MKNLAEKLDKKYQALKKLGQNYLTEEFKDYFHTQLIFISSKFEKVNITKDEVEEIVQNYPKHPRTDNSDLLQAYGQKKALEFIEEKAKEKKPIEVGIIPEIHFMVLAANPEDRPGKFRTDFVQFRHVPFMTAMPFMIPGEMRDFGDWLIARQKEIKKDSVWEILEFATAAHYKIVEIHPFKDGNGRVARIFFNLIMRRYGLPYVIIPKTVNDKRMLKTLQAANQGNLKPLTNFFAELLLSSFDHVFKYRRICKN